MTPSQILSLAYLAGVVLGYFAGAWLPWWIAGLPCYAGAFGAWLVARADAENTREQVTAYAAGMLMGSCASASVVSLLCTVPHATGAIEGVDPCAAPVLVGLFYAAGVWHRDDNPPAFPSTRAQVNALAFGLYLATLALAAVMGAL